MDDRSIFLEDPIWLLLLQDEPLDGPANHLWLDVHYLDGHGKDLGHVGCQPGGRGTSLSRPAPSPGPPRDEQEMGPSPGAGLSVGEGSVGAVFFPESELLGVTW